eukprot:6189467-Pleurochrysis_carterae.AAC.2
MGMNYSSQWFSLYNLLRQDDGLKDQNGTHASADPLAECTSQLHGYIIESIPNDAGGKLLVGQLDFLHGDDKLAAYRYLENKSTVGGKGDSHPEHSARHQRPQGAENAQPLLSCRMRHHGGEIHAAAH